MRNAFIIAGRELDSYFSTPLAYVFLVIFTAAAGALPFFAGGFFSHRQADLSSFFSYHPWLFLALIPAIGMRLWAEERRSGTIEMLMTMPISTGEAVAGKFAAGWAFAAIALVCTAPIWISVNFLGSPDNGVIVANYVASFLLAGALLAISACVSALTRNQVIAFVISIAVCAVLLIGGTDLAVASMRTTMPAAIVDLILNLSFLPHLSTIGNGVLDLRDVLYFLSFIALCLFINSQIVEMKRGE